MKLERHVQQKPACRRRARQEGAVLVEFALVLPLLLLLLLGMLDFGRVFNYWIDQTHLANIGARWAAVDKNPGPNTLQDWIVSQANTKELREGGGSSVENPVEVCISYPPGAKVGDPVEVTVSVNFKWMSFIGDQVGLPPSTTLTGAATMRLEQVPSEYTEGCS